ncbi:MAG: L,D-transpeptidase family protein [Geminicoccaceae bacterium]|nr:L,D-transpeptidase family protein [Geminicoccaceae bacterium]
MRKRSFLKGMILATACPLPFASPARSAMMPTGQADRIVVYKRKRLLELLKGGTVVRTFRVALGRQPRGDKRYEGDGRTPEGLYWLDEWKGDSRFYKSIRISYPNRADIQEARSLGRPAGGSIMLHGLPEELQHWGAEHYLFNWTEGCIAVTNEEMDVIWNSVRPGTPIEIRP